MTDHFLRIVGMPGSPYSRKMRAVLRYRRIPHVWVHQASPEARGLPQPRVALLPQLILRGADGAPEAAIDSTPLIRRLEGLYAARAVIPPDPVMAFVDALLEDYGDEWLTKAMFHYRWAFAPDAARAAAILPRWSRTNHPEGQAVALGRLFSERQIGRLGVVRSNETTASVIEASYRRLLRLLDAHLTASRFVMGGRPGASDFGLFGQLTQLAAFDPTPAAIALGIAPRVVAWVDVVEDLSGLEPSDADWTSRESVPDTLRALLAEAGPRLRAVPDRQRGGPAARRRARRVQRRWPPVGATAFPLSREVSALAARRPCGACARRPPRRRRAAAGYRLRAALRRRSAMTYRRVATLLALSLVATGAQAVPGPWQRTEAREPCASFELFRQPYFGDTHVHTAYSSDAVFAGTRENPRGAYRFAEGEPIGLPPYDAEGTPTRTAQLRRPLDFTAVTDHAEQFGEIQICLTPGLSGYDSDECVAARDQLAAPLPALSSLLPPAAVINFLLGYGVSNPPQRFSWCGTAGADCLQQASLVWQDTQAAAEEFYDRTAACTFTTFAAYEWSGQPGGNNLHRNVIFRNAVVPALPTSYMEQPTPQGLWATLQSQCVDGLPGCDVLAIPHNPNASGGLMFAPVNADGSPLTATDAAFRSSMEPLVEMNQHKGDSECRPGVQSTDEICGFEKLNRL